MKTSRLSAVLTVAVIAGSALILSSRALADQQQLDLGIDTEMSWADQEGAQAAADDARQAAAAEKERLQQERAIAKREEKKARKMEAQAKLQIAKYQKQTAQYKNERAVIAKQLAKSKAIQDRITKQMQAKEAEVNALHEVVEQIVAEKDQTELVVEQAQEKIAQLEKKKREDERRRKDALMGLDKAKKNLGQLKEQLRSARAPASRQPQSAQRSAYPTATSSAPRQ